MAGKRGPGSNLTQDNWDQEEPKEQAGQWTPVSGDELSRRKIHVAKRRSVAASGSNGGSATNSPFAQISLMKGGTAGAPTSSSSGITFRGEASVASKSSPSLAVEPKSGISGFNVGARASGGTFINPNSATGDRKFSTEKSTANNFKNPSSSPFGQSGIPSSAGFGGSGVPVFGAKQATSAEVSPAFAATSPSDVFEASFYSSLARLNEEFSKAVADESSGNRYSILTPLFREYETYVEQLKNTYRKIENSPSKPPTTSFGVQPTAEAKENSGFKLPASGSGPAGGFGFASGPVKGAGSGAKFPAFGSSTGTSAFNTSAPEATKSSGFSFGSSNPSAGASGMISDTSAGKAPTAPFFSVSSPPASTNNPSEAATEKPNRAGSSGGGGGGLFSGVTTTNSTFGGTGTGVGGLFAGITAHPPGGSGGTVGGFSFSAAPSASSSGVSAAPGPSGDTTGDEPYVPPEPEVNFSEEPGAIYSIKCKLFYSKSGQFVEKGVGMLHLKPTTGAKTQLLIRAATTLGNILLNVKLQESTPLSRQGKNNVLLVCVPNPPLDPRDTAPATQATSLLIKVKTEADADELKDKLEKYKVSCENGAKTSTDNDNSRSTGADSSNESNANDNEDNDDDSDIVVLD